METIEDAGGDITRIERDPVSGAPEAIVAPDGQRAYTTHVLSNFELVPTQVEMGWANINAISTRTLIEKSDIGIVRFGASVPGGEVADRLVLGGAGGGVVVRARPAGRTAVAPWPSNRSRTDNEVARQRRTWTSSGAAPAPSSGIGSFGGPRRWPGSGPDRISLWLFQWPGSWTCPRLSGTGYGHPPR